MDGKDHVYSASMKTKMEGMLANVVPGSVKAAMHEKRWLRHRTKRRLGRVCTSSASLGCLINLIAARRLR
jgi:hypothetical protein